MSEKLKHYAEIGNESYRAPNLLFEVHLGIRDVRSGFSCRHGGFYRAAWLEDPDLIWTKDLVVPVDPASLKEITPPWEISLPPGIGDAVVRHFVNSHRVTIWRNSALDLYSAPGESRNEFRDRCLAAVSGEWEAALAGIRGVFLRQFLQLEQRRLEEVVQEEWLEGSPENRVAGIREGFLVLRDGFARVHLRAGLEPIGPGDLEWAGSLDLLSEERLEAFRNAFVARYNEQAALFLEKVDEINEYQVALPHSQVEVLSIGALWRDRD